MRVKGHNVFSAVDGYLSLNVSVTETVPQYPQFLSGESSQVLSRRDLVLWSLLLFHKWEFTASWSGTC